MIIYRNVNYISSVPYNGNLMDELKTSIYVQDLSRFKKEIQMILKKMSS